MVWSGTTIRMRSRVGFRPLCSGRRRRSGSFEDVDMAARMEHARLGRHPAEHETVSVAVECIQ